MIESGLGLPRSPPGTLAVFAASFNRKERQHVNATARALQDHQDPSSIPGETDHTPRDSRSAPTA